MNQNKQFFKSNWLHRLFSFIVYLLIHLLIFSSITCALETSLKTETVICEGTNNQTVAYFFSSDQEGPTIMIMAGVHGNELAGIEASRKFMENFEPEKGSVIFIPEANKEACKNKVRSISLEEDLNRAYPGDFTSQGINRLAGEIFRIMRKNKVDFLLDLHESINYYKENPSHYGQTIVLDNDSHPFLQEVSDYLVRKLNLMVIVPENYFEVIVEPISGCSTYEALTLYGIPGITFETCTKIEFSKRVAFHYDCIQNILVYFNIISSSLAK